MNINFCSARCGAGKTVWAIDKMASQPIRWLYVVDRRDVMPDRMAALTAATVRHGTSPFIRAIHTPRYDGDTRGSLSVRRDIETHPNEFPHDHQILVITHEALKSIDTDNFWGWSIVIDEIPTIWHSESINTPALRHQLTKTYALVEKEGSAWRKIVPKAGAVSAADISRDDTLRDWTTFHRFAMGRHGVYTALKDWADTAADQWTWWTLWSPLLLRPFANRYILANAVEHSVTYHLIKNQWPEVAWTPFTINASQDWQHREVLIRFFVTRHRAGSSFWASQKGAPALEVWANWIADNTSPDNHMWTCNKFHTNDAAMLRIGGDRVSPKIAGSNEYRNITTASVAYTAKPSASEINLFKAFDITPDQVIRAREYEDLIQILFRTSLRVPDDRRPVVWNVYDRKQAEFLESYLIDNGFPVTVELLHEDIGIDFAASSAKVRNDLLTEEERAAKIARAKEDYAARKRRKRAEATALKGVSPKGGRPKCPVRQAKLAEQAIRRLERQARRAASTKRDDKSEDMHVSKSKPIYAATGKRNELTWNYGAFLDATDAEQAGRILEQVQDDRHGGGDAPETQA